jgi:hypothetical protein
MRRSELSALDVSDLHFVEEGVDVLIRRGKTDPQGEGRTIGIPRGRHPETCPALALERWLPINAQMWVVQAQPYSEASPPTHLQSRLSCPKLYGGERHKLR